MPRRRTVAQPTSAVPVGSQPSIRTPPRRAARLASADPRAAAADATASAAPRSALNSASLPPTTCTTDVAIFPGGEVLAHQMLRASPLGERSGTASGTTSGPASSTSCADVTPTPAPEARARLIWCELEELVYGELGAYSPALQMRSLQPTV